MTPLRTLSYRHSSSPRSGSPLAAVFAAADFDTEVVKAGNRWAIVFRFQGLNVLGFDGRVDGYDDTVALDNYRTKGAAAADAAGAWWDRFGLRTSILDALTVAAGLADEGEDFPVEHLGAINAAAARLV